MGPGGHHRRHDLDGYSISRPTVFGTRPAENYPLDGQNSHVPDGHNYVPAVSRGYSLAWLFYRLYNDPAARPAFVGATPQIASNPDWQHWASASLT